MKERNDLRTPILEIEIKLSLYFDMIFSNLVVQKIVCCQGGCAGDKSFESGDDGYAEKIYSSSLLLCVNSACNFVFCFLLICINMNMHVAGRFLIPVRGLEDSA